MNKLDELKKFVAENFHEASNPESIEKEVKLNNLIAEAQKESNEMMEANTKLSAAYRELVSGTAGTIEPHNQTVDSKPIPSLEDALNNFAKGLDIYGTAKR